MDKFEFIARFVLYCFERGFSFDPWDIHASWDRYQRDPWTYKHLLDVKVF